MWPPRALIHVVIRLLMDCIRFWILTWDILAYYSGSMLLQDKIFNINISLVSAMSKTHWCRYMSTSRLNPCCPCSRICHESILLLVRSNNQILCICRDIGLSTAWTNFRTFGCDNTLYTSLEIGLALQELHYPASINPRTLFRSARLSCRIVIVTNTAYIDSRSGHTSY